MMEHQERKPFEIGLVMAGAVSAGAYTAGVIDFILQALEEWYRAKKEGKDVPSHDVSLKVISGASAGGMTGAIIASMLNDEFAPVTSLPTEPAPDHAEKNKLYNSWVEQIDIFKMLGDNDLKNNKPVQSLLDSTVLDEIAKNAISFSSGQPWRPYVSDPLHLYLTLTNLQGVPYDIKFKGASERGHTVTQHADYLHFTSSPTNPNLKEAEWLNAADSNHSNWKLLKQVALATGAFPAGLAPRIIDRRFEHYDFRQWPIPQRPDETSSVFKCIEMEPIKPSWPKNRRKSYRYLSVDGGVMDNEPLELARRELAGPEGFNPRNPENAHRATIMIDPFPSGEKKSFIPKEKLKKYDIVDVFISLFGSLKSQARFKPDELLLANSEQTYSRYLVAPTRSIPNKEEQAQYPIASGFLGGFGGFFSKQFRMHDYQLGRRNCQRFLQKYFAIPVEKARENEVFAGTNYESYSFDRDEKQYIPVIPLVGSAKEEVKPIPWDDIKISSQDLDNLREGISSRTGVFVNSLLNQKLDRGITRGILKVFVWIKRNDIVDWLIEDVIKEDLKEYKLIE